MHLDWNRIERIEREYSRLDPMEAYYRKRSLNYIHDSPLAPNTIDVLRTVARRSSHVLDIGCGDGSTLVTLSSIIQTGTGFDQSRYALSRARQRASGRHISNLRFVFGMAVDLPFENGQFDLVYSERGPIGHSDLTLEPALRVLRVGGRLFYETLPIVDEESTLLTSLDRERDRLERHGVAVEILCTRVETICFADIYQWIELQCSIERYLEHDAPYESVAADKIEQMLRLTHDAAEQVTASYRTIWAGGKKEP